MTGRHGAAPPAVLVGKRLPAVVRVGLRLPIVGERFAASGAVTPAGLPNRFGRRGRHNAS